MREKLVSIVIPTYNNERTISACLESIRTQDYPSIEVIIADGFSTDRTVEIATKMADRVIRIKGPIPFARNTGFQASKGSILVSIDSDMILRDGLIREISKKIEEFDALILPETGIGEDFVSRCKDLEKRCYIWDEIIESSRAFRRDAFFAVSGYDGSLVFGEDWDIHARLKARFRIGRTDVGVMHDVRQTSMISDLKKAYRYGHTLPRYLRKRHQQSKKWLDPRNFFFIKNASKLLRQPLEAFGLALIKGAEYAFGLMGFIVAILSEALAGI